MQTYILDTAKEAGSQAAVNGANLISNAIEIRGVARVIMATGVSQFEMLSKLVEIESVDWSKCTAFHLDEYIGISDGHPASFVKYLRERFVARAPKLGQFEAIDGSGDPMIEMDRLSSKIAAGPIDVAFVGIGENGHLAFNDPPADFTTESPYIKVELDDRCRSQQVSEGWFASIEDVPTHAISMSIQQILKSENIICTVLDTRKAEAVKNALEGPISNLCPASILQQHSGTHIYLDKAAAEGLSNASN